MQIRQPLFSRSARSLLVAVVSCGLLLALATPRAHAQRPGSGESICRYAFVTGPVSVRGGQTMRFAMQSLDKNNILQIVGLQFLDGGGAFIAGSTKIATLLPYRSFVYDVDTDLYFPNLQGTVNLSLIVEIAPPANKNESSCPGTGKTEGLLLPAVQATGSIQVLENEGGTAQLFIPQQFLNGIVMPVD